MDMLPEDIQSKIYLNKHTLEFHTTLEKIKHVKNFRNYSEDMNEFNYSTALSSVSASSKQSRPSPPRNELEKEYDEATTCFTYTPTEDWNLDADERFDGFPELYEEYQMFIDAGTLNNSISLNEQLKPLTYNRKIHIDMSCDVEYFFDEHFFDVHFWEWMHYEKM